MSAQANTVTAEGIVTLQGPTGGNEGYFTLPIEFDRIAFVANWVKIGPDVEKARQLQPILGTRQASVGWETWKYPKGHRDATKPCKVTLKSGEYVLMYRPRKVQQNVNAIYGNVSKRHLLREQRGETIGGTPVMDPGVLNHERITENGIRDFGDDYVMNVVPNRVAGEPVVEAPPIEAQTENTTEN